MYLYDANGSPVGMRYRTSSMAEGVFYTFWFDKNAQGDVVAILDDAGNPVVEYTYDAWGNLLSTNSSVEDHPVAYNPLRYRGYVYGTVSTLF